MFPIVLFAILTVLCFILAAITWSLWFVAGGFVFFIAEWAALIYALLYTK